MNTEHLSTEGFSPEPRHGALITGLLDVVASTAVPADRLTSIAAEQLARLVGDAFVVSLLSGRALTPVAVADRHPAAASVLAPLIGTHLPAGERHDLGPYVERFGLRAEFMAPMRARGRVVGQVVALRRGSSTPFSPVDLRLIGAVADVLGLGLDESRVAMSIEGQPAPDNLSHREREILALLALGHTNREIAEQVRLSVRTVEWHRARIQTKLHVTGRAALAQVARTHGLVGGSVRDNEA